MFKRYLSLAALAIAAFASSTASAQVTNFFEDFEGLDRNDPGALAGTGWNSAAAAFDFGGNFVFFGAGGALNDLTNPRQSIISDVPSGGAPPVGNQGLVVFSDYGSDIHFAGAARNTAFEDLIISVFQERTITAADIGNSVEFSWTADGNSAPPTGDAIAEAFVLILDPNTGFSSSLDLTFDTAGTADGAFATNSLSFDLNNPLLDGQILQFGFRSVASDGEGSAVDYDNVALTVTSAIPEPSSAIALALSGIVLLTRRRRS